MVATKSTRKGKFVQAHFLVFVEYALYEKLTTFPLREDLGHKKRVECTENKGQIFPFCRHSSTEIYYAKLNLRASPLSDYSRLY